MGRSAGGRRKKARANLCVAYAGAGRGWWSGGAFRAWGRSGGAKAASGDARALWASVSRVTGCGRRGACNSIGARPRAAAAERGAGEGGKSADKTPHTPASAAVCAGSGVRPGGRSGGRSSPRRRGSGGGKRAPPRRHPRRPPRDALRLGGRPAGARWSARPPPPPPPQWPNDAAVKVVGSRALRARARPPPLPGIPDPSRLVFVATVFAACRRHEGCSRLAEAPPPQPSLLRARVREMSRLVTARYTPDAKRTAAAAAAALGPNGQWMPVIGQFRVGGRKLQSPSFFTGYTRCTRTDLLTADLHGGEIVGCCRCNWLDRPTALTLVKDLTNQRWTTQRVMSTARPRRRLEFKCIQ